MLSRALWQVRRRHSHDLLATALLLLLTGLVWGFVGLADNVFEEDTRAFDRAILLALRSAEDPDDPIGPGWVEEMGRDFTALGGVGVLTGATLAVVGFLLIGRSYRAALFVVVAVAGGILVSSALKIGFERPRPDLVPHRSNVTSASFPSGHSMMSAVTYFTLAALLARLQRPVRLKIYLFAVAFAVTFLVGISRLYVGVHWPTDVLAGWTAGLAWALLCSLLAAWLQRRGRIEPESDATPV